MAQAETIRSMLQQGKGRIAKGRVEAVAALVTAQPGRAHRLMECLWDEDPGVANRAAHALELFTRERLACPIEILNEWKSPLLGLMAEARENKLCWHLALIVPRLTLDAAECRRATEVLRAWAEAGAEDSPVAGSRGGSSIVRTMAMQGMADLTRQHPGLLPEVFDLLRIHGRSGTPAMRARARILLAKLEAAGARGRKPKPVEPGG